MSTQVEQRVVEMRFDNQRFERNAATTMSTLEKLKQKLNFSGASKGLENLSSAASKVNVTGLGKGVDTVMAKFSALEVMGVTALANITNSAVNAGKRMVSALTIDPIKTGFSEYETQINAIQTILANTESKGTTLTDVNAALDTLNTYADKTIYNFTEMTRNIGTFTAAGIDLETSVKSIQGIANLAAVSGSTSQQASTAMYQLSQALASGTVKLMDWNSVVNAGMGGQVFQDALKETARVHGVAIDDIIKKNGSFRESLREEWLTADILNETLEKFTLTTEGLTDAQIEQNRQMLKSKGYTDEQIEGIFKLGKTATNAATKVKTFTQLWDTLKESAQSGWTQTWELIVGDFEQSKKLLTSISEYVGGIINKSSEKRNNLLSGALTSNWDKLIKKINKAGIETNVFEEKLKSALTEGGYNVEELIEKHGSLGEAFRSGAIKADILKSVVKSLTGTLGNLFDLTGIDEKLGFGAVGEDVKKVQTALEKLGYTLDKFGVDGIIGDETTASIKKFQADSGLKVDGVVGPETLAALEKAGKATADLTGENEKLVDSYDDLIDAIQETSGREKVLEGLKNVVKALVDVFKTAKGAWEEIFPPKTMEQSVSQLSNAIDGFLEFTKKLKMSEKTTKNLTRVFKGLFAALDIISTVTGGALKIAFKFITKLFGIAGDDVLELAANLGDAIVMFRDWIDAIFNVDEAYDKIAGSLKKAVSGVKDWVASLKDSDNIGRDIALGLIRGLGAGISIVWNAAMTLGKAILDSIKSFLGIHSPSTKMIEVGEHTIEGLTIGLQNGLSGLWNSVKGIGSKLLEWFKGIDFGTLFAVGVGGISIGFLVKIGKALSVLAAPLESLGDLFDKVGDGAKNALGGLAGMFKAKGKEFKANAWKKRADAILSFALAIGVLAVSMRILGDMDWETQMKPALKSLAALTVMVGALAAVIGLLGPKEGLKLGNFALTLLGMSVSMLLIASAVKKLSDVGPNELKMAGNAVGQIAVIMAGLALIAKIPVGAANLGGTMIALAIALGLMVGVVKLIATLGDGEIDRAVGVITKFIIFIGAVALANLISGKYVNKIGRTMIALSIALALMVGVVKLVNKLTPGEIDTAVSTIGKYLIFVAAIAALSAIPGAAKIGGSLLGVTLALMLMVGTVKLINKLTETEIDKATGVIGKYLIFVAAIAAIGLIPGSSKIGATMLMISVAIGILVGIVALAGLLNEEHMNKGLKVVGVLMVIFALMIAATKLAQGCVGNLVVMTVAIAVMTAAVAVLSTIEPGKLAGATAAIGILMGMFALMVLSTKNVTGAMGTLIVMGLVVALLAGILYLLKDLPIESTLGTALAISIFLVAMAIVFDILGEASVLAVPAMIGAAALMAVIAIIGVLAMAIGGLMSLIPQETINKWKTGLENFMDFIVILATGLGEAIGGFVGGALSGISDGVNDLVDCLKNLTGALGPFAEAAKKLDGSALTGVQNLVRMVTAIAGANLMDAIASWIGGSSSMDKFASSLKVFGDAIVDFSNNVAGKINEGAVKAAGDAGRIMTALQASIPKDGWFDGRISLDDFGKQIKKFGKCLVDFSDEVADLNTASINTSTTAASMILTLAQSVVNMDLGKLKDFKSITKISDALSKYSEKVTGLDSAAVSASIAAANRLITLINNMSGIDISGVNSFKKAMTTLGKTNLDGFVEAFSKATPAMTTAGSNLVDFLVKGMSAQRPVLTHTATMIVGTLITNIKDNYALFQVAGIESISKFIVGISSSRNRAATTVSLVCSGMITAIRAYYSKFYTAGGYLVTGFASGISANSYKAAAKARAMANAAEKAARDALDINSPSKVFYGIGAFAGQGFVNAFADYESVAFGAGSGIAKSATKGLTAAISRISDAVNSDIDAQPVIRPVLDLSAVRAGAESIGGMFGMNPSVGLLANVGSINTAMNRRQNGGNADVISAITELGRKMGTSVGPTYNINGVNVSGDAEVAEAFKVIVRAIEVGRRR